MALPELLWKYLSMVRSLKLLVGLAPLFVDNQTLHFVGGVDVSDYLDFQVDRDYHTQVYKAIVDYLTTEFASEWQAAYFCSLACRSLIPEIRGG